MQREGHVHRHDHHLSVLVPRQEITGADRQWAERYEPGDVVRYSRGSKALGIDPAITPASSAWTQRQIR